jgi:hypothetical protein
MYGGGSVSRVAAVVLGSEVPREWNRVFGVFVEDAKDAVDMGVEAAAAHG